ncbi:MAG: thiamine pyrophosphate-binding protein [Alphaproteobacteria bacterium]
MTDRSDIRRSGGRILVDALQLHGTDTAFCVAGESYLALLDALYKRNDELRLVTCRKETGASFMAEAYGKLTGRPGICMVTRGPGSCNASIGVHEAFQDSTPMILFIGQVPRHHRGREAFQEADFTAMFAPLAKATARIEDIHDIPEAVAHAFHTAVSGRPGPVVVEIPEDVLSEEATVADIEPIEVTRPRPEAADMDKLRARLAAASRPLMIVGGSGWTTDACRDITEFAAANGLGVATSFRRQDIIDNDHACFIGGLGLGMAPSLFDRVKQADVILAVGCRLGDATTGGYSLITAPKPAQSLIHVYGDAGELGRVFETDLAIHAGIAEFAAAARAMAPLAAEEGRGRWREWTKAGRDDFLQSLEPDASDSGFDLGQVMTALRLRLPEDAIITLDAGNFAGWPQRFLNFRHHRTQIGPTGGAMGYGVPAAIAAKIVHPGRTVVGFVGDGGFMMTENELATAADCGADPIIIVFNNRMYGTIRMHQERRYPGRVIATGLTNPDFAALARSYGAFGETVTRTDEFLPALEAALAAGTAAVIELAMDPDTITTRTTLSAIRAAALARDKD